MSEKKEKRYVSDNAQLMSEWNWEKNEGLNPNEITVGSGKKVWWKCRNCGNEWEAIIKSRKDGRGCLECARQKRKASKQK